MENLICLLFAIQRTSKGIHYKAKGNNFYSDHLLCDRIYDGLDGFIDDIFENCFVGKGDEAPQQSLIIKKASSLIPDITDDIEDDFKLLGILISNALTDIQGILKLPNLTAGDNDLLGRICSDLQKKIGFLSQRVK